MRAAPRVTAFARSLGKEPIAARDNSGFVVNRLLVPFLLDAIRAHEHGVGSLEDIDTGLKRLHGILDDSQALFSLLRETDRGFDDVVRSLRELNSL